MSHPEKLVWVQAIRAYLESHISRILVKFNLESIEDDPCVYISKNEPQLIIMLFVDDGLVCGLSPAILEALIQYMEEHFAITQSFANLYVELHILQHKDESSFIKASICAASLLILALRDACLSLLQLIRMLSWTLYPTSLRHRFHMLPL